MNKMLPQTIALLLLSSTMFVMNETTAFQGYTTSRSLAFLKTPPRANEYYSTESSFHDGVSPKLAAMSSNNNFETDSVITTKASTLDKNLTKDEKSVVDVFRRRGPSVAYVSSTAIRKQSRSQNRRSRERNRNNQKNSDKSSSSSPPLSATPLGSGSAFCIASDGYFLTNYHVVERAYLINQNQKTLSQFVTNFTKPIFGKEIAASAANSTNEFLGMEAKVYLRTAASTSTSSTQSGTKSIGDECRIVAVKPELDIAILHLESSENNTTTVPMNLQSIPYGSSSDLLVGQSVLAIGNPFGLDQTLTTGVVSALDRTFKGVAGNDIRGCIQTDAAINPGNSGGPLLDISGNVLGVNTAILSTSGSNAGIGFAVPIDPVMQAAETILDDDRDRILEQSMANDDENANISGTGRRRRGYLGATLLQDPKITAALCKRTGSDGGVFILSIKDESPAAEAGLVAMQLPPLNEPGQSQIGDRIVAVGGKLISDPKMLVEDLKSRVEGEQISITVENSSGERRVVYVTLGTKPKSS